MGHCRCCNEEFEAEFGYNFQFCDRWCAQACDVQPIIYQPPQALPSSRPKTSIFQAFLQTFFNRGRSAELAEIDERLEKIKRSNEYIRLRKRFEVNEITCPHLKKVTSQ